MCEIIGYSDYRPAVPLLIEGLRRLEYRGYDSSGVAFVKGSGIEVRKAAGKLSNLETKLDDSACMLATAGIGHTRWATHGLPVERNAHPHLSQDGKIAIIHNGIIENFQELKKNPRVLKVQEKPSLLKTYRYKIELKYEQATTILAFSCQFLALSWHSLTDFCSFFWRIL